LAKWELNVVEGGSVCERVKESGLFSLKQGILLCSSPPPRQS